MPLMQYIVVRSDLIKVLKWNMGAIIAQCCHGVAAVSVCLNFIDRYVKFCVRTRRLMS